MKLPPPTHHIDVDNGHYTVTITDGVVHINRPTWADPPPTTRPPTSHRFRSDPSTSGSAIHDAPVVVPVDESNKAEEAVGKVLHPLRAFPMVGDPPPLIADPGFDPWGPEVLDSRAGDPPRLVADPGFDPWGPDVPDSEADDSRPIIADPGFDPWGPEVLDTG